MIAFALHLVFYICAGIGAGALLIQIPRVRSLSRKRKHEACIARIAKLELVTGVGLDWGRDWLAKQEPKLGGSKGYWSKRDVRSYATIVELICLGCDKQFKGVGGGELGALLCRECVSVARKSGVN